MLCKRYFVCWCCASWTVQVIGLLSYSTSYIVLMVVRYLFINIFNVNIHLIHICYHQLVVRFDCCSLLLYKFGCLYTSLHLKDPPWYSFGDLEPLSQFWLATTELRATRNRIGSISRTTPPPPQPHRKMASLCCHYVCCSPGDHLKRKEKETRIKK